jgi:hypothetical protein
MSVGTGTEVYFDFFFLEEEEGITGKWISVRG